MGTMRMSGGGGVGEEGGGGEEDAEGDREGQGDTSIQISD